MNHLIRSTILAATFPLASATLLAGAAVSTFDTDTEGWSAFGDTAAPVSYVASGGNPGGFIQVPDSVTGGVMYWSAPAKFLGDHSAAYGTNFTFDLMQSYPDAPNQFADGAGDVLLSGASLTLAYQIPANPANNAWTSYSVPLLAEQWHLTDLNGGAPTPAQMQSVLSNLTALSIRAEYQTGPDTDSLDNVHLVPEPTAGTLTLAASALCLARRGLKAVQ